MPTRRDFVRTLLLASAAALAPTHDAIGALPWWWAAPRRARALRVPPPRARAVRPRGRLRLQPLQ